MTQSDLILSSGLNMVLAEYAVRSYCHLVSLNSSRGLSEGCGCNPCGLLVVVIEEDKLVVRRGDASVEVLLSNVRDQRKGLRGGSINKFAFAAFLDYGHKPVTRFGW